MSAAMQDLELVLRPMREVDLGAVMDLERLVYPYPWTEGIFRDCLREGYSCWVLSGPKEVVGYGVLSATAGERHILNLCVHPGAQRQGLGRRILRHLLASGRSHKGYDVFLEVRASNRSALALYALEGFCEVGMRRGYYPLAKGREDAVIMARSQG